LNFQFTEEQRAIVDMARSLAQSEKQPGTTQINEAGLFGIVTPEQYGGFGMGLTELVVCLEQLSGRYAGLARTLVVHNLQCASALLECGSEAQKDQWLPKLSCGDVLGSFATVNVESVAKNVVQGAHAGLLVVDRNGEYSLQIGPFDAQPVALLGFAGAEPARLLLPAATQALAGPPTRSLARARVGMAAIAVRIADAALRHGAQYSLERTQFDVPIAEHQAIQWKIADSAMAVEAARLLTWRAANYADRGLPFETHAAQAATLALEAATVVTDHAVQIHGGYGYTDEFPVCGLYQDARACWLADGGLNPDRDRIGRAAIAAL
jgi:alkylation response protein AidB-like acyl-CoA dehydrogenase